MSFIAFAEHEPNWEKGDRMAHRVCIYATAKLKVLDPGTGSCMTVMACHFPPSMTASERSVWINPATSVDSCLNGLFHSITPWFEQGTGSFVIEWCHCTCVFWAEIATNFVSEYL